MSENKIEIKNLAKSFAQRPILTNVNLEIKKGDSYVIIGGSGSGKSVMLKLITGLISADKGSIKIDGEEAVNCSEQQKNKLMSKIGILFQGAALFDSLPVWRNIGFVLKEQGKESDKYIREVVAEKLKSVGLSPDIMDLYPADISGGMQKRVGLARAVAHNPEIIFFDEPTTGLDPISSNMINDLIKSIKQSDVTTVTITHDINSLMQIATKVGLLYEGEIIWQGTIEELKDTDNQYVRQFIAGKTEGPIKINY